MPNDAITLTNLATFAVIASAAFAIANGLVRFGMSYLQARFGRDASAMTPAEQSAQCQFDHSKINSLMVQQNGNIGELLKQNGEQIKALQSSNHNAELRHQVILARLDKLDYRMEANRS